MWREIRRGRYVLKQKLERRVTVRQDELVIMALVCLVAGAIMIIISGMIFN